MKLAIASVVSLALGLSSSLARADEAAPGATARQRADADCQRARAEGRICRIDIDGITVDGDRPGGDGMLVTAAMWASHDSLIRLRRDFIDEIVKAADDIE
jgi:hypothetical protein